jgi:hypothetical protein
MAAARRRAAFASARSGIGTHRVQEGLDHEPDTGSQGGCKRKADEGAEDNEY